MALSLFTVDLAQVSSTARTRFFPAAATVRPMLLLARVLIISRHMDLHNVGRDAVLVGDEPVG